MAERLKSRAVASARAEVWTSGRKETNEAMRDGLKGEQQRKEHTDGERRTADDENK